MTRQELCEQYNIAESTVKTSLKQVQKRFDKKGLILTKQGRGDKADYIVVSKEDRSSTFLETSKVEIGMTKMQFHDLKDFRFIVLLGIITCPHLVFRGTLSQFLDYIQVEDNKYNRQILKESFQDLVNRHFVLYADDNSTDEGYFIISILRKKEQEMSLGIEMIKHCQLLSQKSGERVTDLIKVWTAMGYAYYNQPFTMKELEKLTGLSSYKIRGAKKVLEGDNLFTTSKVYETLEDEEGVFCLGQEFKEFNILNKANQELLQTASREQ